MATASVTSKGQITIPIEVRKDLGLKAGDRVQFVKERSGRYSLKPQTGSIEDVRGMVKWTGKPLTIAQMNKIIRKGWAGQIKFED